MKIRGVIVNHATIQRWVYKFATLLEAAMKKRKAEWGRVGDWMRPTSKLKVFGVIYIEQ
jgi:putative transposase